MHTFYRKQGEDSAAAPWSGLGPLTSFFRWFHTRRFLADAALAVVAGTAALILSLTADTALDGSPLDTPIRWWHWPIMIGAAWMIPFRRLTPTIAVGVGAVLQALTWSFNFPDTYTAMAILLYSAAAYGGVRGRRWSWGLGVLITLYTVSGVAFSEVPLYAIPIVGLFSAASASFGTTTASRQAYTAAVEARAADLEQSRQMDRDRALVEERARIARELHDVVAHGLSVIVVQASAAQRIQDRDPAGTAGALKQIEQTGRTALGEMRQVLGAIRTEPSESWQPAPGLAGLDDLVAEMEATGLQVTVVDGTTGMPELENLPATVDLTAYRIIQEALTNVLKHGGRGAKAVVDISRDVRTLDLRISDNGRGANSVDGGGHGLQGMQERVEVFGGRFDAGPRIGGGFVVTVSLPVDGAGVSL